MKDHSKIHIVGAGAIGRALAVMLQMSGKEVMLLRGRDLDEHGKTEQIRALVNGTLISQYTEVDTIQNQLDEIKGLVVITAKAFGNASIAQRLQPIRNSIAVILLQNGLNVETPFEDFPDLFRCVLFATSQIEEDGVVSFKPVDSSPVGIIRNSQFDLDQIIESIHTPNFPFHVHQNIEPVIWEKAIVNCAFNSICPLLEQDNGIFYRNEQATKMAQIVLQEGISIAQRKGIHLQLDTLLSKLLLISRKSSGQMISTYEDIKNKRRTEIDYLNVEIARLANENGSPEQARFTGFLGELIALKSNLSRV